jgi:hypothetical protein
MNPQFKEWVILRLEKKDTRKKQNLVRALKFGAVNLAMQIMLYNLGEWVRIAGHELQAPIYISDETHEAQEILGAFRERFAEEIDATTQ